MSSGFRGGRIKKIRLNREITAPEVRVISADGEQLGVMTLTEAIAQAEEQGLDLVEIQPQAQPPVTKVLDWGKYQYEQTKQSQKQRARGKAADVKGIRLGLKTSPHDLEIKAKRASEFLEKGHKVKVSLILRGRENARPELGQVVLARFIGQLTGVGAPEGTPARQGREISQLLIPAK